MTVSFLSDGKPVEEILIGLKSHYQTNQISFWNKNKSPKTNSLEVALVRTDIDNPKNLLLLCQHVANQKAKSTIALNTNPATL